MGALGGLNLEAMQSAGLSKEDIAFIRKRSADYRAFVTKPERILDFEKAASALSMASLAFEAGLMLGLAREKNLPLVRKRMGF